MHVRGEVNNQDPADKDSSQIFYRESPLMGVLWAYTCTDSSYCMEKENTHRKIRSDIQRKVAVAVMHHQRLCLYDDVTTMLIQQQVSDLLHGSKPLNNGQLELCGMGMLDRDTDTAENTAR